MKMKADTAPVKCIENIIRFLIATCMETNEQLQAAQRTIRIMSRLIEELTLQNREMGTLRDEKEKLEIERTRLQDAITNLQSYNDYLSAYMKPGEGKEDSKSAVDEMVKVKMQRDKLQKEIDSLKEYIRNKDIEYNKVWGRYTFFRKKTNELTEGEEHQ